MTLADIVRSAAWDEPCTDEDVARMETSARVRISPPLQADRPMAAEVPAARDLLAEHAELA